MGRLKSAWERLWWLQATPNYINECTKMNPRFLRKITQKWMILRSLWQRFLLGWIRLPLRLPDHRVLRCGSLHSDENFKSENKIAEFRCRSKVKKNRWMFVHLSWVLGPGFGGSTEYWPQNGAMCQDVVSQAQARVLPITPHSFPPYKSTSIIL